MHKTSYYIINGITFYRVPAAFLLLYIIIIDRPDIFKWLLAFSFFTDAIDGFLARKFKVVSVFGAKMDSLGDDLTVLMGIIGIFAFDPGFIYQQLFLIFLMAGLLFLQITLALIRFGKTTSFHTYLAKIATLFQGIFLILFFFLPTWPVFLFYLASAFTILDLIEEICLVIVLREWRVDIKGWFWLNKKLKA